MEENMGGKGLSFCEVLTLVFIVLKFLRYIRWSWIVVISPLLIEIALTIILSIIIFSRKRKE